MKNRIGVMTLGIASMVFAVLARPASAASIVVAPSDGTFTVGQKVQLAVVVQSPDQAINADEGVVSWDPGRLAYQGVSIDPTINAYWVTQPKLQGNASLVFSGGLPSPGYSGSVGRILTITFTAAAPGSTTVDVSGTKLLANDGGGGDVSASNGQAAITIADPVPLQNTLPVDPPLLPAVTISSTSHPDQTRWYQGTDVTFSWTKPNGLVGVSYSLTTAANAVPDEVVNATGSSAVMPIPADGTWYLNVRGRYASGWGATSHFLVHLDRSQPNGFTPSIIQHRGLSDPSPELSFATTDTGSGIAKYSYSLDDGPSIEATSPTDLAGVPAGTHTVKVTAFDQAGNSNTGSVLFDREGYTAPIITDITTSLLLMDTLVVHGTALAGDNVTVYANGQPLGQTEAGQSSFTAPPGVTVRVPWVFSTQALFRPGILMVTAASQSLNGLTSVQSNPRQVRVSGQDIVFHGHSLATFSVLTPLAVLVISLLLLVVAVCIRLLLAVWIMHRHQRAVENELETLRTINRRQPITQQQLETTLGLIEEDLDEVKTKRRLTSKRRTKKRLS